MIVFLSEEPCFGDEVLVVPLEPGIFWESQFIKMVCLTIVTDLGLI